MAVLWNPDNVTYQGQILRETEVAAGKLGIQLLTFGVRGPDEFDRTFAAITSASAATLLVLPDPVFSAYTARITDLANKSQLPTMYGLREDAVAGGLMTYGPHYAESDARDRRGKPIRPNRSDRLSVAKVGWSNNEAGNVLFDGRAFLS